MKQHVYCERCLEVIEEQENLVIINDKPYHYSCYEKEIKEQKKKSMVARFLTWRFINSGIIGNIQAIMLIALGTILYLFGGKFGDAELYRIWGTIIIVVSLSVRLYAVLSFEIKAKKAGRRSLVLQSKDSVLQVVRVEAIDLLKIAGTIAIVVIAWNIITSLLI